MRNEPLRSQIQRVLEALGIVRRVCRRVPAHSPQAKGRVERLFGTPHDRLVKELRRAGARTCAEANQVLAAYLPRFNARPPAANHPWRRSPIGRRARPPG